jgi:hypothetical protein
MAIGRRERRAERRPAFTAAFGEREANVALDLVEILELAWHDCYDEVTPSEQVIDDLLVCSAGRLDRLVAAAHLAVMDWRDLRVQAEELRRSA